MTPRVLVTRPESTDGSLCSALRARGCEPVAAPAFEYEHAGSAPDADLVAAFPWAAWTSAAAVRIVGPDSRAPTRHAAVGTATAAALRRLGISAEIVGDRGADALAGELAARLAPGTRIVHPRSARSDESFVRALRTAGLDVDDPVAYDIVPGDVGAIRRALESGVAAVTFASPSAVDGFCEAVDPHDATLSDTLLASIGPTTTSAMRSRLRDPDVMAATPTFPALAAAVATALERRAFR